MARNPFNEIVTAVIDHDAFFRNNIDCTGKEGISGLLKCTSSIRQLAYDVHADFLDEYMQISERTSRMSLDHFCQAVMQIYGPDFLRKPTVTNVEKLYMHHEEKHEFPGMLRSFDCTDWEWFGCPYAFKAQYIRRDHGLNPFILVEAVASQDLWIWHAFFEIPFVANGVTYPSGYYLVDGIYPELAPLVKTISEPADDDHKRILYKQNQESARKDVERAYGPLSPPLSPPFAKPMNMALEEYGYQSKRYGYQRNGDLFIPMAGPYWCKDATRGRNDDPVTMCSQPLPLPLSPPFAKLMNMALEEYGYQSRRGIRVPKKWRSSYSDDVIFLKRDSLSFRKKNA
nr:hypothetical protein [Tanacetum cinerariifolium]